MQEKECGGTDLSVIWDYYFHPSVSPFPPADAEAESKILRSAPAVLLDSSWYTMEKLLRVSIKIRGLTSLTALASKEAGSASLALSRLLSILTGCISVEDSLLWTDPLLLHPDLIFFSNEAKLLCLPFYPGQLTAGYQVNGATGDWIFASKKLQSSEIYTYSESSDHAALKKLFSWFGANYKIEPELQDKLMSLCDGRTYRELKNAVAEISIFDDNFSLLNTVSENKSTDKKEDGKKMDKETKKVKKEELSETNKNQEKEGEKAGKGFLRKLRTIYKSDFAQSEKTMDLLIEDPFFRMACLSEGLTGSKNEKLGQRAFILTDEFLIGRDADRVDFWIDSPNISRLHARIVRRQGSFFLEDLGSHNSTLLDGKKVNKHKEYLLPDKCRLTFADQAYYFEASS